MKYLSPVHLSKFSASVITYLSKSPFPSTVVSTISCLDPGRPRNGLRTGDKFTEGSIVDFKCNTNFKLIGSPRLTCQSDGKWSDRRPECAGMSSKLLDVCHFVPRFPVFFDLLISLGHNHNHNHNHKLIQSWFTCS